MTRRCVIAITLLLFSLPPTLVAQHVSPAEVGIRASFDRQATDWNRGDLDTFATAYKNSPDILFIGSKISRGYTQMLERYHTVYSTKEKMGTLTFSDIEVQPLDDRFATATGRFHLERTTAGGGNADGSYMLVFEKTQQGWKIVRDVTPCAKAIDFVFHGFFTHRASDILKTNARREHLSVYGIQTSWTIRI